MGMITIDIEELANSLKVEISCSGCPDELPCLFHRLARRVVADAAMKRNLAEAVQRGQMRGLADAQKQSLAEAALRAAATSLDNVGAHVPAEAAASALAKLRATE